MRDEIQAEADKKLREQIKTVMLASRGLTAWEFARDVANKLHAGIDYKGCSKSLTIESLLGGDLHKKARGPYEIIARINEARSWKDRRKEAAEAWERKREPKRR